MKKLLLSLFAVIATIASCFAAAESPAYTCAFNSSTFSKGVSSYTATWTNTYENHTWDIVNFNNNNKEWNYIRCGRKSDPSVASITTDFAPAEKINKVVVKIDAVTVNNVTGIYLQVSSSKTSLTSSAKITSSSAIATGNMEFTIPNPAPDQYYRLTFDCAKGKNGSVQVSKIEYYAAPAVDPSKTEATLSWSKKSDVIKFGQTFEAPSLTKSADDVVVTYASDNAALLAVDASTGTMTFTENVAGTAKITATVSDNDPKYYGTTPAVYTLTVIDPNAPFNIYSSSLGEDFTFENPTGLEVWKHDSTYGLKGSAYISGKTNAAEALAVSPVIDLTNCKDVTLDFKSAFNNYKINNVMIDVADFNGYAYIVVKEETAEAWTSLGEATKPTAFSWDFKDNATVDLSAYSNKKIRIGFKYVSTTECAGTWEVKEILIKGKEGINTPKTPSQLAYSADSYSVIEGTTDLSGAPVLENPLNIDVVYSSTNAEVATIENGTLVLKGATGSTTISAAPADTETYTGTAFYTLTVTPRPVLGAITVNGTEITDGATINGYEGDTFTFASENAETLTITILNNAGVVLDGEIVNAATYIWTATAIDTYLVEVTSTGCGTTNTANFDISITEKALVADFIFSGDNANVVALANKAIEAGGQGATSNDLDGVIFTAENGVTVTTNKNGGTNPRYWSTTNGKEARIYKKNTLTVAAPAGYKLVNIEFTKGPGGSWTMTEATPGAFTTDNNLIWTNGEATINSVVFSVPAEATSRTDIGSISVTIEPLAPAAPTISIDGVEVNLDESYNLNNGSKTVVITAAEGHHIYHKFEVSAPTSEVQALAETTADGFTHVESNTATLNISTNGTLSFYAADPATDAKSDVKTLTFNGGATGISEIEAEGNEAARWYDLQGRRVAAPAKGNVYIIKQGSKTSKRVL